MNFLKHKSVLSRGNCLETVLKTQGSMNVAGLAPGMSECECCACCCSLGCHNAALCSFLGNARLISTLHTGQNEVSDSKATSAVSAVRKVIGLFLFTLLGGWKRWGL